MLQARGCMIAVIRMMKMHERGRGNRAVMLSSVKNIYPSFSVLTELERWCEISC